MLGLPQSTEVKRLLPKAQLYKRFDWKPSQRDSFDAVVARLDFVNWLSPQILPAIAEGSEVKEIFVVKVVFKSRNFDIKNIAFLGKSIPQYIIYMLHFEDLVMFAVYHSKLFTTPWQQIGDSLLPLNGLNLDAVWLNLVYSIGDFSVEQESSLTNQIQANQEHAKIERQITALEKQMRSTTQPRRQRELYKQIKELKSMIL